MSAQDTLEDDQPFIDEWPMWEEPLSKVVAPFDIEAARWRLARHFNSQPPKIPPAIREREIDRAWRIRNEPPRRHRA